jgi:hypothetical protein
MSINLWALAPPAWWPLKWWPLRSSHAPGIPLEEFIVNAGSETRIAQAQAETRAIALDTDARTAAVSSETRSASSGAESRLILLETDARLATVEV